MPERYEYIVKLKDLYAADSPLIVSDYALLKDTKTNTIIAQCKFQNIVKKLILAVFVDFSAKDISGESLEGVKNFQYLDLKASKGDFFGSKTPVIFPDSKTRQFGLEIKKVIYSDNVTWEVPENADWATLPEQQTLEDALKNSNLAEQYVRDTSKQSRFAPIEHLDLWFCSCGNMNKRTDNRCFSCNTDYENVFAAFDYDKLKANHEAYNERLRIEAVERAEKERIEAEEKEREKKIRAEEQAKRETEEKRKAEIKYANDRAKTKFVGIMVASFAVLLIAGLLIVNMLIAPSLQYNRAETLFYEGRFDESIIAFTALEGWRDSETRVGVVENAVRDLIREAHYLAGVELLNNNQFQEAINEFRASDGWNDSDEKILIAEDAIRERYYLAGLELMSEGRYIQAYDYFVNAEGHRDGEERAIEARYYYANDLFEARNFEAAALEFENLGAYRDSVQMRISSLYNLAVEHMDNATAIQQLNYAQEILIQLGDYRDSESLLEEIYYQRASLYAESNRFTDAISALEKIDSERAHYEIKQVKALWANSYLRPSERTASIENIERAIELFDLIGDYESAGRYRNALVWQGGWERIDILGNRWLIVIDVVDMRVHYFPLDFSFTHDMRFVGDTAVFEHASRERRLEINGDYLTYNEYLSGTNTRQGRERVYERRTDIYAIFGNPR